VDGSDRSAGDTFAQDVDCRAMRKVNVMDALVEGLDACGRALTLAEAETEQGEDRGLVESGEAFDPIAVSLRNQRSVVGKPFDGVSCRPSSEIVQRLR